jgi:hypothetical protein
LTVGDRIAELEKLLEAIEDDLYENFEKRGIYGGGDYDILADEAIEIEQEIQALRLADEDDEI